MMMIDLKNKISWSRRSRSCGESGDYGVRLFVLDCGCWEKMIERNKIKFFYLLYINIIGIMGNGPWASGGPGQVPLLPWPRAGPGYWGGGREAVWAWGGVSEFYVAAMDPGARIV